MRARVLRLTWCTCDASRSQTLVLSSKMKFTRRLVVCLWAVFALAAVPAAAKKKNKLETITESMPQDCTEFAETGDTVTVHYTGALENGQVFDSSRQPGREPFTVKLGAGQVIKGWDEGLKGMCVGEVRKLIIPSHLAYGDEGRPGVIPGGATLIFSVELLQVEKQSRIKVPKGSGFWTTIGVIAIVVMAVYELYRRATQQSEEIKRQKKERGKGEHQQGKNKGTARLRHK